MSGNSNFRNNKGLAKLANNFDKFLDTRSCYDAEYLKKYDTLSLNAPAGPNPGMAKEHYCSDCGQPKNTKLQNLQNPYSPCMNCGSIHRAQDQAGSPLYIGRSQYDMAFDKKYDALSLNAAAGPNPGQQRRPTPMPTHTPRPDGKPCVIAGPPGTGCSQPGYKCIPTQESKGKIGGMGTCQKIAHSTNVGHLN